LSDWEEHCKIMTDLSELYRFTGKWQRAKAVGDKLQEENQILHGHIEILSKSNKEKRQILKTLSRMLDEWEKSTSHPDSTLVNIRNLKKAFAQNTDYVQKEEAT